VESVVHECVHSHRERETSLFFTHTHTHEKKEEENDSTDSVRSGSRRQMHHARATEQLDNNERYMKAKKKKKIDKIYTKYYIII
jgi:hypothetical protein